MMIWDDEDDDKPSSGKECNMDEDEKELVRKVDEEQADFYAGLMALSLYRFQKETKLSRQLPTEGIQKLVIGVYKDLEAFNLEESEGS